MQERESRIPSASFRDNVAFNLHFAIPTLLQGSFTPRPFWVGILSHLQRGPTAVDFVIRLRKKLEHDYIWVRLGGTKSLLVLDPAGISRVLDHSPEIYADPAAKRDGMCVFQPQAVTISRGADWDDRRRFNESVLDYGVPLHCLASRFLEVIQSSIGLDDGRASTHETWKDFDELLATIARHIIFGRTARDDTAITGLLEKMLCEANRPRKPEKSEHFDEFYGRIGEYIEQADPDCLVGMFRDAPQTERTQVENQIPHWMFAMWKTLGANTVRALALILAHPEVEQDVRREIAETDLTTAGGVDRLTLLEGCVQEAMRIWPTTPILLRESILDDELGGHAIERGSQVLILNRFNHRDRERYKLADTFAPHAWLNGSPHPLFLHFSGGPQDCVGKSLASFVAKATLATLLTRHPYRLLKPSLDPTRPLPHAYNFFRVRFACS